MIRIAVLSTLVGVLAWNQYAEAQEAYLSERVQRSCAETLASEPALEGALAQQAKLLTSRRSSNSAQSQQEQIDNLRAQTAATACVYRGLEQAFGGNIAMSQLKLQGSKHLFFVQGVRALHKQMTELANCQKDSRSCPKDWASQLAFKMAQLDVLKDLTGRLNDGFFARELSQATISEFARRQNLLADRRLSDALAEQSYTQGNARSRAQGRQ